MRDIPIKLVMIAIFLLSRSRSTSSPTPAVAYRLRRLDGQLFGRLTLNPSSTSTPSAALMLIITVLSGGFLFGWAKPTPVNPINLRDRRNGEVMVALAGPVSNLIMADRRRLRVSRPHRGRRFADRAACLVDILAQFVVFNVVLLIFNLIPVPPLDGSTLPVLVPAPQHGLAAPAVPAQYGMFIVLRASSCSADSPRRSRASSTVSPACPGGRVRSASSGRTSRARVRPEERPDAGRLADAGPAGPVRLDARRRPAPWPGRGGDAAARGRDRPRASWPRACSTIAPRAATGVWPAGRLVAGRALRAVGTRVAARRPWLARRSCERLRDHAERSAELGAAAGCSAGHATSIRHQAAPRDPRLRRRVPRRRRGLAMTSSSSRSGRAGSDDRASATGRAARDRDAGHRCPAVRRAAGAAAGADRAAPAGRADGAARGAGRCVPRGARGARGATGWRNISCVRGGRQPAHPDQDPGAAAAAAGRRRGPARPRTARIPEAELRARLIVYRAYRDAGRRAARATPEVGSGALPP